MYIKHLGIIPDGNRRWARERQMTYVEAYEKFADHICNIVLYAEKFDFEMITFYIVSKENLERKKSDLDDVMGAVKEMLQHKVYATAEKVDAQIRCIGMENVEDRELVQIARELEKKTQGHHRTVINFLIGYNPFDEVNVALKQNDHISIDVLAVPQYVDLLIRTAGNPTRLSNFLPLQCGYANIETVDEKFLDLTCEQIESIIEKYKNIVPKYGK